VTHDVSPAMLVRRALGYLWPNSQARIAYVPSVLHEFSRLVYGNCFGFGNLREASQALSVSSVRLEELPSYWRSRHVFRNAAESVFLATYDSQLLATSASGIKRQKN
jgi:hypothetical protein